MPNQTYPDGPYLLQPLTCEACSGHGTWTTDHANDPDAVIKQCDTCNGTGKYEQSYAMQHDTVRDMLIDIESIVDNAELHDQASIYIFRHRNLGGKPYWSITMPDIAGFESEQAESPAEAFDKLLARGATRDRHAEIETEAQAYKLRRLKEEGLL